MSLFFKYDGHWVNGKLHGPVNMILANHVYLGHFLENRVSYLLKHSIFSVKLIQALTGKLLKVGLLKYLPPSPHRHFEFKFPTPLHLGKV